MWDCSEANAGESVIISSSFGLHRVISHSCSDMRVLLHLWGISMWLSLVLLSKKTFLTCFIGNKKLLCTHCRGIGPHLSARGKSHGFSQDATRTWGMISSYGGDSHYILLFVQRCKDSYPVMMEPKESELFLAGQYGRFWRWGRRPSITFYVAGWYWDSYPFSGIRHRHLLKHWIPVSL